MGQPTSHALRVAMVKRHEAGETLAQIATSMQLSVYTVRTYWRRYRTQGWAAIQPPRTGPPGTGPLGQAHHRVKYVLLRLKRQHPGWGVDKLRLALTRRPSLQGITIPQRSALAAYLAGFRSRLYRPRRRPTRRPADPVRPVATQPHQGWQIDIKGDESVLGIGRVAPLMVCDTASGAPLAGIIHTVRARGNQQGLTARVIQADLRGVFTHWGLPDVLQMDNDSRFIGSTRREWPGVLVLWLIGLGVQPHINRVYRPTDNAIVERNHQTWMAHVVVAQHYADVAALQAATDAAFEDRIDALPTRNPRCDGRPPSVAFPQLRTPRRPYDPTQEAVLFDLSRVDAYLAGWRWQRTVDRAGKISLADRNYRVGTAVAGQVVQVQYDPTARVCVGRLADGTEVLRQAIPEFAGDWIRGVHLTPL